MAKKNSPVLFGSAVVFAAICAAALSVFSAQRKVTIFKGTDMGVVLQNGSTVAVNYDVLCYDKTGAASYTLANMTLNPKKSVSYPKQPLCANGSTGYWGSGSYSGGPVSCSPYVTYASAASNCGTGYALCTAAQYESERIGGAGGMSGWFTIPTGYSDTLNSWSISWDGGTTWTGNSAGYVPGPAYNSTDLCTNGTSTLTFCGQNYYSGTAQSVCCSTGGGVYGATESCEVTVNTADGYLQSPQFKGGAPF